jgi:hypothetical protein
MLSEIHVHARADQEKSQTGPPSPVGCLVLIVAYGGLVVLFFGSQKLVFAYLQKPVLVHLYGPQAYSDGLRVTGRQGQLSDGRRLQSGWYYWLCVGSFLGSVPIWLTYCLLLASLGLLPPDQFLKNVSGKESKIAKRKTEADPT